VHQFLDAWRRQAARLLLLTVFAIAPAFAAGLTLEQVARLQNVTGAAVSPDGRHIAHTLSGPPPFDEPDGAACST
jgi:hypothetical protein